MPWRPTRTWNANSAPISSQVSMRRTTLESGQQRDAAAMSALPHLEIHKISRPKLAKAPHAPPDMPFHAAMSFAASSGLITNQEYGSLAQADLIITGQDRSNILLLARQLPSPENMETAARLADILNRATSAKTLPVLAYWGQPPEEHHPENTVLLVRTPAP